MPRRALRQIGTLGSKVISFAPFDDIKEFEKPNILTSIQIRALLPCCTVCYLDRRLISPSLNSLPAVQTHTNYGIIRGPPHTR